MLALSLDEREGDFRSRPSGWRRKFGIFGGVCFFILLLSVWGIWLLLVSLAAARELGHRQRVLLCSVEAEYLFSLLVVGEFLPDFVKFGLEVPKYFLSVSVVVVVVVLIGEFPNALN